MNLALAFSSVVTVVVSLSTLQGNRPAVSEPAAAQIVEVTVTKSVSTSIPATSQFSQQLTGFVTLTPMGTEAFAQVVQKHIFAKEFKK